MTRCAIVVFVIVTVIIITVIIFIVICMILIFLVCYSSGGVMIVGVSSALDTVCRRAQVLMICSVAVVVVSLNEGVVFAFGFRPRFSKLNSIISVYRPAIL